MDFSSWLTNLREILQEEDSPLSLRNGHWEVVDRKATWEVLGTRIFDSHLDLLKKCAIDVLTEIDPQFELPTEERFAASIHGKVFNHSPELRQGMAETLALLGNHYSALVNCSSHKPIYIAQLSIREIFNQSDWRLWGSLTDVLPTLAEAAPDEFLCAVENALQTEPSLFDELFAQEGDGFSGRNYMVGLLWALEVLAWNEENLVRVILVLADLASHDPGGSSGNRPINSLTSILLPWNPQTLAPIYKRITSITTMKTDFPEIAWIVLLRMLPNQSQMTTGTYKPRWRSILPENWKPKFTDVDYWDQINRYAKLAVEMACDDLDKLKKLVSNFDSFPKPSADTLLDYLSSEEITKLPETERLPLWSNLVKLSKKHRRFSHTKWALNNEIVSRIESTAQLLVPVEPENLHRQLFSISDHDLYNKNGDWADQQKIFDNQRVQVIIEILITSGLQGVKEFADAVDSPYKVGLALGQITNSGIEFNLLPEYLTVTHENQKQFSSGYIWNHYQAQGWHWVDSINRTKWSLKQSNQFLKYLPFETKTWHRAKKWLGKSENQYWKDVLVTPHNPKIDLFPAIELLLKVSRPQAAIDCLSFQLLAKQPIDNTQTIKTLLDAVSSKEPANNMDSYQITELIKALQNDSTVDKDELFKIEWAYLPILDKHSDARPKLLESFLATQPNFFCEVIRLIYRSKNEDKNNDKINQQQKDIVTNAWQLLHEWKRPPGFDEAGIFSKDNFENWLKIVKNQCKKSGHLEVAMITLGEVLFYCPTDPSGLWITETAAKALNAKDSEDMRRGFSTEIFNSRGTYWVDPTGKPEQELATQWRKKADDVESAGFSRFAASLRKIAKSYDLEANRVIDQHKLN